MLKTPRFLLAAGLVLALAFTFSCSGDDGDSPQATPTSSSSDAGVSQLPSSPSAALSSSSEDAALSSSSNDEELIEVSSSSEEESSSSATPPPPPPPPPPPYYPPNPPVVPSSSSLEHSPSSSSLEHSSSSVLSDLCASFIEGEGRLHEGELKKEFCDKRDGKIYVKVKIGEQTWMAENLNYAADGSTCYNGDEDYCDTYGRLYTWNIAMDISKDGCNDVCQNGKIESPHQGICPKGWHIPERVNGWNILQTSVGGNTQMGSKLKAKSELWLINAEGNVDEYGFSGLPAGTCNKGNCKFLGTQAYWWTATIFTNSNAKAYYINFSNANGTPGGVSSNKDEFYSIRCLED
jgi:uncharacterized protein (TIGR02145 family)